MDNVFEIKEQRPIAPVGWLETTLPKTVMMRLRNYIETAKKDDIQKTIKKDLAGNISKSLTIEDKDNWFFQSVLVPHVQEFVKRYPSFLSSAFVPESSSVPFLLSNFWVNFQKQHEFNPMHNHSGVYSFVVFMKIPTVWKEQCEIPFVKESNSPKASAFEFVYTDIMGTISQYTYCLNSSFEGIMLFFPAEMMHQVYPFYNCEEERITISGNIVYDI